MARITMIQINILKGEYLDALVSFLQKEDPDVITMQEVTGFRENRWRDKTVDLFPYLQKTLRLNGVCAVTQRLQSDPASYVGTAVFTKGKILRHETVWLRPFRFVAPHGKRQESLIPRSVPDVTVRLRGKTFHVLSVHGAWTREPKDTPEKLRQMRLFVRHIRSLRNQPFLLGGDLNMEQGSKVISMLNRVAKNAVAESSIQQTTHPKLHKTVSIKPNGLLVDYIYTSKHFRIERIDAPVVDVSDHLPVRARLRFI